eukprot:2972404-Pyramimonas_sp.AAC.1
MDKTRTVNNTLTSAVVSRNNNLIYTNPPPTALCENCAVREWLLHADFFPPPPDRLETERWQTAEAVKWTVQ